GRQDARCYGFLSRERELNVVVGFCGFPGVLTRFPRSPACSPKFTLFVETSSPPCHRTSRAAFSCIGGPRSPNHTRRSSLPGQTGGFDFHERLPAAGRRPSARSAAPCLCLCLPALATWPTGRCDGGVTSKP